MNRACALLASAVVLWGTMACQAGDGMRGMVFAQQKTTSQPEPAILPPPTALPAEPQPVTLPAPQRADAATPTPAAPVPCQGVCASCRATCAAQCQRFIEWATYRPLTRCGPCGCLPCIAPCCSPPLYTFFLTDCMNGGTCGCAAAAHPLPPAPCKTSANKPQPTAEAKSGTNQHPITGLLPLMKSCIQCGFSPSAAVLADPR